MNTLTATEASYHTFSGMYEKDTVQRIFAMSVPCLNTVLATLYIETAFFQELVVIKREVPTALQHHATTKLMSKFTGFMEYRELIQNAKAKEAQKDGRLKTEKT